MSERVHAKPRGREGERGEASLNVEELARVAIDCAFRIYRDLGPGLLESVYESVLANALTREGLSVERQRPVKIRYDGMEFADAFRVDILVEGQLIIEIKSVETMAKVHAKQLLTYLRLSKQPVGLLINFGSACFKEGVKRVVNEHTNFASSRLRVHQNVTGGAA